MIEPQMLSAFLEQIAGMYAGCEIADIQIRSGGLVCVHTNRGLEKAEAFGAQSHDQVKVLAEQFYNQRALEPWEERDESAASARLWESLRSNRVVDLSIETGMNGTATRMRVQIHLSQAGLGITCRCLPGRIPALDTLGLEPFIVDRLRELVLRRSGLGLLTGPTGSGKSTTLAALLDWVRCNAPKHIVTLEDPIEFIHRAPMPEQNRPAVAVPAHTRGAVLVNDPALDLIPTLSLHGALHRLSETLTFVLSQGLLTGFNGRVLVTEYLQNTSEAVSAGIRAYDGAATSLEDALRYRGNLRWEDSVKQQYRNGLLPEDVFKANQY